MRDKTLTDLAWGALTEALASRCATERGAAVARALPFFADVAAARVRVAEIAEARLLTALAAPLAFPGVRDVAAHVARAHKGGVLEGAELLHVGQSVAGVAGLRRHVLAHRGEAPLLGERVAPVLELAHVSGPILDCVEEGGRLADHASPALGPLRRRVAELNETLARRARALVDDPDIAPLLQDRFYTQRDDRYVLPLKSSARSRLKGIVHGSSGSGQTVFVEPEEIVDLNNKLKLAESEVFEEERRILTELSGYVAGDAEAILAGLDVAEVLDVIAAGGRLADAQDATAPELVEAGPGGDFVLPIARHPLMVLGPRACVPSDLALAAGQTLVVSGPNAGGKTVALKTMGLVALMARAGLHVPAAPGARVPFFDEVRSDIGDDQSIERNLSSFSAHLLAVKELVAEAGPKMLVLLDEIAVGTEPEQGAALAQAVLEALAARGAQVVVTTHYERLKALAAQDARFVNASVGFDLEKMAPTFTVTMGVPGSSAALLVARRMGLPPELPARAEALLGDRRAGVEELMVALAEERRRLDEERRVAGEEKRRAESERREAEAARREAERRLKDLRKGAHDEALGDLRRARDELQRVQKLLRKAGQALPAEAAAAVDEAREALAGAAERVAARAPEPAAPGGKPARAEDLRPGVRVLVPRLNGRGEVVSVDGGGKKVVVQVGALKTTVALDDLRLDDTPPPNRGERRASVAAGKPPAGVKKRDKRAAAGRAGGGAAALGLGPDGAPAGDGGGADGAEPAVARTPDATCDLRGQRVDEGLAELDRFLDDSLLAERECVFVIHGHGTGAMKAAVRAHLSGHHAVDRLRAGLLREGGDGVTVVWLA